jgi:hypothetical protein
VSDCKCIVIDYPCFGCVPVIKWRLTEVSDGIARVEYVRIQHCQKSQDWDADKNRFNQRVACDESGRDKPDYCDWDRVTCPECSLTYLDNPVHPVHPVHPVCSRERLRKRL